jgi:2-polyprenyl-3-methyl-5-hydroxy-6-metoxy-1,4-benzoquinol methylase
MPLLPDTTTRRLEPELMDAPSLAQGPHRRALRGLARINAVSRSAARIWSALRGPLASHARRPYRVLDIACGGGDVAVALERLARRSGVRLQVDGCDVSSTAVEQAKRHSDQRSAEATFFRLDAIDADLPDGYDAMVSNLFLHHLSDNHAADLLKKMSVASPTIVVTDLVRSSIGYAAAVVGTRLLSRSPIVHIDGPRSVRAAFTLEEARLLAQRATLKDARIDLAFPYRWRMRWCRS